MNWYLSKIVYRIVCGSGKHTAQFDAQLRLVTAQNEYEALQKARKLGEEEAESFYNEKQELVKWQFIGVAELYRIHQWTDGAEIYSRIEEHEDADSYIAAVQKKASLLNRADSRKLLHLI